MNRLGIAVFLIIGMLPAAAQQPPARNAPDPEAQQPLTFKVEINYVEIDATVAGADGAPLVDLGRDDFEVFEEGRAQAVTVFSRVDIPVERPDPPLFRAAAVEPDVRTNRRPFDGRVFVLVLDDLHTGFERTSRVRRAAAEFVERHLGANDLAAVITTSGTRGGSQEFTTSRALLLRAIERFAGQRLPSPSLEALRQGSIGRPRGDPYDAERAHKARTLLSSLKGVAEHVTGVRGRRKAVVLFSEGIDYDINNPLENRYASDITAELRSALAAAARANVSFYAIDPRGLTAYDAVMDMPAAAGRVLDDVRLAQDSLRVLADETGGVAAVNRNDYGDTFERIIRDNSSYYVLGYYSDNARRDGRFRPVEVRVRRPGATVRARKGYSVPRGAPAASAAVTRAPAGASPELRDALNSPVPVSGLGLSASVVPFAGAGRNGSVLVLLEIDGGRFRFAEQDGRLTDELEYVVVPVDAGGRARDGARDEVRLTPRPQTRDIILARGVRVLRRLDLPPGRYSFRIAAREAGSGATGSLVLDADVPDFGRTPLALSGLVLTSKAAAATPTARPDEALDAVLQGPPTTVREFEAGDELTIFTEVTDTIRKPHRVEIETTVTADDGRVVDAQTVTSDERADKGGGFPHVRRIPLNRLGPGRFVVRVAARTREAGGASASRELEIRVR